MTWQQALMGICHHLSGFCRRHPGGSAPDLLSREPTARCMDVGDLLFLKASVHRLRMIESHQRLNVLHHGATRPDSTNF